MDTVNKHSLRGAKIQDEREDKVLFDLPRKFLVDEEKSKRVAGNSKQFPQNSGTNRTPEKTEKNTEQKTKHPQTKVNRNVDYRNRRNPRGKNEMIVFGRFDWK